MGLPSLSRAGTSAAVGSGSSALGLELLLLLDSSGGSFGGGAVGNGCWVAASEGVVDGAGESGGGAGLADSPGNGNCSAADGFFVDGVDGGQGLVVWSWV